MLYNCGNNPSEVIIAVVSSEGALPPSSYPIQEWRLVSLDTLMIKVDNIPYLNEISKNNDGTLSVYVRDTGSSILDQKHITQTYEGINCTDRYFLLSFENRIDPSSAIPFKKGILYLENPDINPEPPVEPVDPRVEPVDPRVEPVDPPVEPVDPPVEPVDPVNKDERGGGGGNSLPLILIILSIILILIFLRNK